MTKHEPVLISRQSLANSARYRWSEQYSQGQYGDDKLVILSILENLGDSPSPDIVDSVIGNGSWTKVNPCSACGEGDIVVQVGEPDDYESSTAWLCEKCLIDALNCIRSYRE